VRRFEFMRVLMGRCQRPAQGALVASPDFQSHLLRHGLSTGAKAASLPPHSITFGSRRESLTARASWSAVWA
jgi:hypothetical protein